MNDEQLRYLSTDPHTAIPNWLPFQQSLSAEARIMVIAAIVLCNDNSPTRQQLAEALGVDVRSVYRWMAELRDAGVALDSVLRAPAHPDQAIRYPDRLITDRLITDRLITDQAIRLAQITQDDLPPSREDETAHPDQAISDSHVGVGVGHSSNEERSPTNQPRRPLKTPLARWLRHQGIVGAYHFDDPKLDFLTYRRDFERKRGDGWTIGLIVDSWLAAPLDTDPLAAQLELLGEEISDQLAEPAEPAAPAPAPAALTADEAQARFERLQREREKR